jgi:hypothetical protein
LAATEQWLGRFGTLQAMLALCWAKFLIAAVPLGWWRGWLGSSDCVRQSDEIGDARRLARQVDRAAQRLPGEVKCLPRAMALSWILRARHIRHAVVFAVRPADRREQPDALHAWVEIDGNIVLGKLPGPWIETLRLGN